LQKDVFDNLMAVAYPLSVNDPVFAAKLCAYLNNRDMNKDRDMSLISIYVNAFNYFYGQKIADQRYAPDLRRISRLLISNLTPKYFYRLASLQFVKWQRFENMPESGHFPGSLRRAMVSYLESMSLYELQRSVQAGYKRWIRQSFRLLHATPDKHPRADEVYALLNWKPKKRQLKIDRKTVVDLSQLSDSSIIDLLKKGEIDFRTMLSAIDRRPSAELLAAVLDYDAGTPNQVLINQKLFYESGLLEDDKYNDKFIKLVSQSNLEQRIDDAIREYSKEDKERILTAKAEKIRSEFSQFGKIALLVDSSSSMQPGIEFAKKIAAIIAEFAGNENNFFWTTFAGSPSAPLPYIKTSQEARFYLKNVTANGMTDIAGAIIYTMKSFNPDIIIIITDLWQTVSLPNTDISGMKKPKIINVEARREGNSRYVRWLEKNGFDYEIIEPNLFESRALIA
ncbi:VWA domain-containing protein, partial [Candidatus Parcubacteria bacterium]